MKRAFLWVVSNADTLVALAIAVLVSVLGLVGAVSSEVVANATIVTLAALAFIMLHDRRMHFGTMGMLRRLERKFDERNPIQILTGPDISRAIVEAHRQTEQWFFRGSTATYVRVVILPDCISAARRDGREFRMRLEILDPASHDACESYVRLYRSLAERSDGPETRWTVQGTRIELYATILAVCWHKQRYEPFTIEVGLSAVASTLRWEASSDCFILTQRGPRFPAMQVKRSDPFYSLFVSELNASFRQARRVPMYLAGTVQLSDMPSVVEVRELFSRLDVELPPDFDDEDVSEIIAKALDDENPYRGTGS
jgi:hypothetical protein